MGAPVGRINVPTDLAIDARDQLDLGGVIDDGLPQLCKRIENGLHTGRMGGMGHVQAPAIQPRLACHSQQCFDPIGQPGHQDLVGAVDPGQRHLIRIGGQQRLYPLLFCKDHGGGTSGRSTFDQFRPLHH